MSNIESLEVEYPAGVERSPESERAESITWNVADLPGARFLETVAKVEKAYEGKEFPGVLASSCPPVKRIKRTEQQVLEDLKGDLLGEASYLKERVSKLESKLAELFASVTPEAAALVIKSNGCSHLERYLP